VTVFFQDIQTKGKFFVVGLPFAVKLWEKKPTPNLICLMLIGE
jgi:hypothetical protein